MPAGVVAQAWRGSARQARIARVLALRHVATVALDEAQARAVGSLCARSGSADIVDASAVSCARERGHAVITSDPDDLRRIDAGVRLVTP